MNGHAPLNLMAIIKLLGKEYSKVDFYSKIENGVDVYTKVIFATLMQQHQSLWGLV